MNETRVLLPPLTLGPPTPLRASIIIVAYNAQAYLEKCLLSVLETSGMNCEVILVDNASSDGSAERAVAARLDVAACHY